MIKEIKRTAFPFYTVARVNKFLKMHNFKFGLKKNDEVAAGFKVLGQWCQATGVKDD